MKKRTKVFLGIGLIVAAMAALMVLGLSKSQTYYVTLEELLSQPDAQGDRQLRVNGRLIGSSVSFDPEKVLLTFQLREGDRTLSVVHNGVRPGAFEDDAEVLVEGRYQDGVFVADNVLTKCPSKYEAKTTSEQ